MKASLDPKDLNQLIKGSKIIYSAMKGKKKALKEEKKTISFAFASIASTKNISVNETLTEENIFPIRPGTGYFKVKDFKKLVGKKAKRYIKANTQIKKNDV